MILAICLVVFSALNVILLSVLSGRPVAAFIDRSTHRVHVVGIQGESYRLKASLEAKKGGGVPQTPTS